MAKVIGRFLCEKNIWEKFQDSAKSLGYLSASECLRARAREVNELMEKMQCGQHEKQN